MAAAKAKNAAASGPSSSTAPSPSAVPEPVAVDFDPGPTTDFAAK